MSCGVVGGWLPERGREHLNSSDLGPCSTSRNPVEFSVVYAGYYAEAGLERARNLDSKQSGVARAAPNKLEIGNVGVPALARRGGR